MWEQHDTTVKENNGLAPVSTQAATAAKGTAVMYGGGTTAANGGRSRMERQAAIQPSSHKGHAFSVSPNLVTAAAALAGSLISHPRRAACDHHTGFGTSGERGSL